MSKTGYSLLPLFILSCLCAFGAEAPSSGLPDKETYLSEIAEPLQAEWPKNRTINIVCHGHSVPAGYFKTPIVDTFNAYPHLLHKELKTRFPHAVINVIVTSIGGENSERGAARFEAEVLTHRPDVITIDYALNDRRIGLATARASWESMIEAAKAKGFKVILLTPTGDQRANLDDPSDPLNQHAAQIRELAQTHGVGLADSLAAFKADTANGGELQQLMSQGNHPNRQGHDLVVSELLQWFPN